MVPGRHWKELLSDGARRGEIHPIDVPTAARVILAALITYTVWFASPRINGDLTGPDRLLTEESVIDVLLGLAGGPAAKRLGPAEAGALEAHLRRRHLANSVSVD